MGNNSMALSLCKLNVKEKHVKVFDNIVSIYL